MSGHGAHSGFIWKYIFSKDHKIIGIQYWLMGLVAAYVGIFLSLGMRWNLAWPNESIWLFGQMSPEKYYALLTMHGTIMVFFVLTTVPMGGFGNYFLPLQIGAPDMAFPTINMLSFWTTFVAFVVMVAAFFVEGGAPTSGWTAYPTLSAVGEVAGPGLGTGQDLWVLSIALFCVASLMGAINFIVTTLDLRTKGMTLMRMPLTVWAWFVTAILALLGFAVLLVAGLLLLLDRGLFSLLTHGTSFFIPAGLNVSGKLIEHAGGSTLLYQHLFWFFGHPEVYIAILPGMGLVSQVLSVFSRKPIFGYRAMVYALFAISLLGLMVWGHHMFVSGMSPYSGFAFSMLTMAIGVPSAIKTFNWLGTMYGGKIRFTTAMWWGIGFVSLFVSGGITGLFLAQPATDVYLHDTYFVVGHFHLIMGTAAIFGMFAGTFYWFPKMFGKQLNETMGKIHFFLTFIGVYAIFMPMHWIGFAGHPRRYADTTALSFLRDFDTLHVFMTVAAIITAAAQLMFLVNVLWTWFGSKKAAEMNPWKSTTLEWTVAYPIPHDNFAGSPPAVHHGAYEYSVPGAPEDYVMQTAPTGAAGGGDD